MHYGSQTVTREATVNTERHGFTTVFHFSSKKLPRFLWIFYCDFLAALSALHALKYHILNQHDSRCFDKKSKSLSNIFAADYISHKISGAVVEAVNT